MKMSIGFYIAFYANEDYKNINWVEQRLLILAKHIKKFEEDK